jgi:predicted RNA methylase
MSAIHVQVVAFISSVFGSIIGLWYSLFTFTINVVCICFSTVLDNYSILILFGLVANFVGFDFNRLEYSSSFINGFNMLWRVGKFLFASPWIAAINWLKVYHRIQTDYVYPPAFVRLPYAIRAQVRTSMYLWWMQWTTVPFVLSTALIVTVFLAVTAITLQLMTITGTLILLPLTLPYISNFSVGYLWIPIYMLSIRIGFTESFVYDILVLTSIIYQLYLTTRYSPYLAALYYRKRSRQLGWDHLRGKFRHLQIPEPQLVSEKHSHRFAASERNAANTCVDNFIIAQGAEIYSIQLSSMDMARGLRGSLTHHWTRDRIMPYVDDDMMEKDVVKLFNVDYYIDWAEYLWLAKPFMLYTFSPTLPCGSQHEYTWTTQLDNTIKMKVTGGAEYIHQLWDYDCDSFIACYSGLRVHYKVENIRVNKHWKYVLIVPVLLENGPVLDHCNTGLKRMRLVHTVDTLATLENKLPPRPVATIYNYGGDDAGLAISIPGEYVSVLLPTTLVTTLRSRYERATLKLGDVQSIICTDFRNDPRLAVALVFSAFPVTPVNHVHVSTIESRSRARVYRKVPLIPEFVSTESQPHTELTKPMLAESWSATRSRDNELWTIAERITKPHTEFDTANLKPMYLDYMVEFARLLLPQAGMLHPVDVTTVIEGQRRAAQVLANRQAEPHLASYFTNVTNGASEAIEAFQKGELYPKIAPPRNISTLSTSHCLLYSQFTQAISKHLKTMPWYAFGMHPNQIAERVHAIALDSKTIAETDFSKFDGTHSMPLYEFELMLLRRAFPVCYHDQLMKVHSAMTNASCRTTTGIEYKLGGGRASGAADTSIGNTIDNAYIMYVMYRRKGMTKHEAWNKLGIFGGDDGISGDPDEIMKEIVTDHHMQIKLTVRGSEEPIEFLARVYPAPTVAPYNMCNIQRLLPKCHAHYSGGSDVRDFPGVFLRRKAESYLVMDPDTPILSEWCKLVLRSTGEIKNIRQQQVYDRTPTTWSSYAWEGKVNKYLVPEQMALNTVARALECDIIDVTRYQAFLADCKSSDDVRLFREPPIVPNVGDEKRVSVGDALPSAPDPGEVGIDTCSAPIGFQRDAVIKYKSFRYVTGLSARFCTKPQFAQSFVNAFLSLTDDVKFSTIIDACAHIGIETSLMNAALPTKKIYAIERDPCAFNCLRVNVTSRRISPMHQDYIPPIVGKTLVYFDPPWTVDRKLTYRGQPLQAAITPNKDVCYMVKHPRETKAFALGEDVKVTTREVKIPGKVSYILALYTSDAAPPPKPPTVAQLCEHKHPNIVGVRQCLRCLEPLQLTNEQLRMPLDRQPKACKQCKKGALANREKHRDKHSRKSRTPNQRR